MMRTRNHWRAHLANAAAMLVFALGGSSAQAQVASTATSGNEPQAPLFNVRLALRGGHLAPLDGSARIEWRDDRARLIFQHCQLDEDAVKRELVSYLQQRLSARPRLLEELTQTKADPIRSRALATLVAQDDATRNLWEGAEPVPLLELAGKVAHWQKSLEKLSPDLATSLTALGDIVSAAYEKDPAYAAGPLTPRSDSDGIASAQQGVLSFEVIPPLDRVHVAPTANIVQWSPLLGPLEAIVQRRVCKLWHRSLLSEPLQDYVEVRHLAASTVLTARDHRDAAALGVSSLAPPQHANIRPERMIWTSRAARHFTGGGRILLEPDPLISTLYLRGMPDDVMQALSLLVPTGDYDRLRQQPASYLCATTTASWSTEPPRDAVQLPLDDAMPGIRGSTLAVAKQYFTHSQLADRKQRLATMGYGAKLQTFHRVVGMREAGLNPMLHLAWLIVEPLEGAAPGKSMSGLLPCETARDTPVQECPNPPAADKARTEEAIPNKDCRFAAKPVPVSAEEPDGPPLIERRRSIPRNHVKVGALWPEGKPLRWTGGFRRDGLLAGDTFQLGIGQQREALGEASYSRDFVGSPVLGRRLQVTGRVYSEFTPQRAIDASLPDERREGAELRGLLDLWRDQGGGFGQADFGIARSRLALKGSGSSLPPKMSTLVDVNLIVSQSRPRTPSNLHGELVLGLARGRADRAGYGRQQIEALAETMLGELDRGVVRLRWGRLTGAAPLAEYLSFGGPDSVRGYHEERATGRRVYSLQVEYARPLPWSPVDEGLARLLRRSVDVAAFVDAGGVKDSPMQFNGRRAAAGLGLRWRYGELVTLRLDAAKPLGNVPTGDGGIRIQFGVVALRAL